MAAVTCLVLPPAIAQTPHKTVVSHASRVVLSFTGVHTHANYILFDTGPLDLLALQRDPAHYPQLTVKAHSSLPTNHAALPPDLAAFSSPGDPPLENPYGGIDGGSGKPGWTLLPGHQNGKNSVKVLVPTRFANWLAVQPPAHRKQYAQPKRYTLTITWESPPAPNNGGARRQDAPLSNFIMLPQYWGLGGFLSALLTSRRPAAIIRLWNFKMVPASTCIPTPPRPTAV